MFNNNVIKIKKDEEKKRINIPAVPLVIFEFLRVFYGLLTLYAAYLCFKKNNGLSWGIIPALIFSPIYIVYVYATKSKGFKMNPFK